MPSTQRTRSCGKAGGAVGRCHRPCTHKTRWRAYRTLMARFAPKQRQCCEQRNDARGSSGGVVRARERCAGTPTMHAPWVMPRHVQVHARIPRRSLSNQQRGSSTGSSSYNALQLTLERRSRSFRFELLHLVEGDRITLATSSRLTTERPVQLG